MDETGVKSAIPETTSGIETASNVFSAEDHPLLVVGIGASAGGLEALESFFKAMPTDSGMAFVVIQHLSPDFKSMMDELLARFTSMAIVKVDEPTMVQANTIFLLPPRKDMVMSGNQLITRDRGSEHGPNMPINLFFQSLAKEQGDKSIAIVLSCTGTDGSIGIMDVHEAGGLVLSQSEDSARFDGMPRSVIGTGLVDRVLPPEAMPQLLMDYASSPTIVRNANMTLSAGDSVGQWAPVVQLLQNTYGTDFSLYKIATVARRMERRLTLSQLPDIEAYIKRLESDPAELDTLYKDLLIGVTRFFRDKDAFSLIEQKVIPSILDNTAPTEEIRVWVSGCATGEEAYSLGILFLKEFQRRQRTPHLKIFATDMHKDSLRVSFDGCYGQQNLDGISDEDRNRFFILEPDGRYRVSGHLRQTVIFSQHNVLRDTPFGRIHLASCRNLLIYFSPTAQARVLSSFAFSLRPKGYLFLGPSESIGNLGRYFETTSRRWKIYERNSEVRLTEEIRSVPPVPTLRSANLSSNDSRLIRVYDNLLSQFMPCGLLANEKREVIHLFGDAGRFLHPPEGRINTDVVAMCHGEFRTAISSAFASCLRKGEKVICRHVQFENGGDTALIDISAEPIYDKLGNGLYCLLLFSEDTALHTLHTPENVNIGDEARNRITQLETELTYSRESLQSTVEELEAANEELQASNEEMQSTNEELQSTNEELHSVNEELYSVNAEHEQKIIELTSATNDLRNLMDATGVGIIFTGRDLCIRQFNPAAAEVFNLLPQDSGRPIHHITSRIKDDDIFDAIDEVVKTQASQQSEIELPDGRCFQRTVKPYKDANRDPAGLIVTFVDITALHLAQKQLRESEERFRTLANNAPVMIWLADPEGKRTFLNATWLKYTGMSEKLALGDGWSQGLHPEDRVQYLELYHKALEHRILFECEGRIRRSDGTYGWILSRAIPRFDPKQGFLGLIGCSIDITLSKQLSTEQNRIEKKLLETAKLESLGVLTGGIAHDFNNILTGILGHSSLALKELPESHSLYPVFTDIENSARRASDLCQQMLAYSGRSHSVLKKIDLSQLTRDSIRLIHASIGKKVKLDLELAENLPATEADESQLRQVIMNLVINAAESIDQKNGTITIEVNTASDAIAAEFTPIITPEIGTKPRIEFTITDTGCGINPEGIRRIFEPFYTTKFTGRGLGLAAVLGIIRSHKGGLWIKSQPGVGTTFKLQLIACQMPIAKLLPTPVKSAIKQDSGDILIVDDEPVVRSTYSRILKHAGYTITTASNGNEALEIFSVNKDNFRMVILDLTMPEMDGADTLFQLKQIHPGIPVLITSGFPKHEAQARIGEQKLAGFLQKPIGANTLLETVQTILTPQQTSAPKKRTKATPAPLAD